MKKCHIPCWMKTLLIEELEEVKWTNEEGWERVRTTLRLVRCFSFVGEATKLLLVVARHRTYTKK